LIAIKTSIAIAAESDRQRPISPATARGVPMPLRTILVHADSDRHLSARFALAATLGETHDARLIVVYPLRVPAAAMLFADSAGAPGVQAQLEAEQEQAANLRARIADRLSRKHVTWEWRTLQGQPHQVLAAASTGADLIVMGQDERDPDSSLMATVALTAGRPVLGVPSSGALPTCGTRILVAWNGTREATRAAHDALPLLQTAEQVILFAATSDGEHGATTMDAAAHFAAHGCKIDVRRASLDGRDAGAAIMNAAAEAGADLIVMGAYGHSRLREWVFGGATRTILQSMTVPVLMSH
jgi:nucleotide-binding universal stress UspA family protein